MTYSASYAIKGCLDYAQPSFSCQAMDAQCLGGNVSFKSNTFDYNLGKLLSLQRKQLQWGVFYQRRICQIDCRSNWSVFRHIF
jgi:hypothetical protein